METKTGCVRMEAMTLEQQKRIKEVAQSRGLREYALISIGLCHAIRASEFCQLRRQDINLQENTITVRRLKNSLTTTERLMPSELDVIRDLLASTTGELLFPVSRQTIYRTVRLCAEAAGLPKSCRGPHSLKHSILQTLCDYGLSLPQLMVAGGHRDVKSSLRYYKPKQTTVDDLKAKALAA
jgi:type 1 fimbriae regulatory protein FimB